MCYETTAAFANPTTLPGSSWAGFSWNLRRLGEGGFQPDPPLRRGGSYPALERLDFVAPVGAEASHWAVAFTHTNLKTATFLTLTILFWSIRNNHMSSFDRVGLLDFPAMRGRCVIDESLKCALVRYTFYIVLFETT